MPRRPAGPDPIAPSEADDLLDRLEARSPASARRPLGLEKRKALEHLTDMGGRVAERAERLLELHDAAQAAAPTRRRSGKVGGGARKRVAGVVGAVKRGAAAAKPRLQAAGAQVLAMVDHFQHSPLYPDGYRQRLVDEGRARALVRAVRKSWRDFDCNHIDGRVRVRSMSADVRSIVGAVTGSIPHHPLSFDMLFGATAALGAGAIHGLTDSAWPTIVAAFVSAGAHVYSDRGEIQALSQTTARSLGASLLYQLGHRATASSAAAEAA